MTNYLVKVEMIRNTVKESGLDIHDNSFVALYKSCYNKYNAISQFNFYANLDRELIKLRLKKIVQVVKESQAEWITASKIVEVSKLNVPLELIENLLLAKVDKTDNTRVIRISDILEQAESKKLKSKYLFNIKKLKEAM